MNKRLFAVAIALCIMLPVLAGALGNVKAVSPAVLSLQPVVVPPADIGKTVVVKLHVDNASNLWSWKVQMTWDPTYLRVTSDPVEGSFLNSVNGTLFLVAPYTSTPGALNEVSDTSLGSIGATGNGDLATFNFTVLAHGYNTTAINLTGAAMVDASYNPITFSVVGANFTNTIPGDINGDGKVSLIDLVFLANAYGTTPASGGIPGAPHAWNPACDLNGNGKIDLADLVALALHYQRHL